MSNYPDDFSSRACDAFWGPDGGEPIATRKDVDDFLEQAARKFDRLIAEIAEDFRASDLDAVIDIGGWNPDPMSISSLRDNFIYDIEDAIGRVIRKIEGRD